MYTWRASLPLILLALAATCIPAAHAETPPERRPVTMSELTLRAGIEAADPGCAALGRDARDEMKQKTVAERAAAAHAYYACVERLTAIALADRARASKTSGAAASDSQSVLSTMLADDAARTALLNETRYLVAKTDARNEFMGYSWGLGFGFSSGFEDAIEDAEVVDGVIRVTEDRTEQPRAVLEFHRFFPCVKAKAGEQGCGPFVAVSATADDVLAGVGMGFAYGWRSTTPTSNDGFTVGFGAMLDANVRSLADGFDEGGQLPAGETGIRFEEKSRWSYLLYVTRSF